MKGSSFKNQLNDRRKERMKRRRREYYFTLFLVSPSTAIIIKQVSLSQSSRDWKPSKPLEEGWGKRQVPLDFHQNERLQESREGKRRKEKSGRWTWVMSRDGVEGKPHASSFHVLSHFPFLGIFFAKELLKSLDTKHLWLSSPSFSLFSWMSFSLHPRKKRGKGRHQSYAIQSKLLLPLTYFSLFSSPAVILPPSPLTVSFVIFDIDKNFIKATTKGNGDVTQLQASIDVFMEDSQCLWKLVSMKEKTSRIKSKRQETFSLTITLCFVRHQSVCIVRHHCFPWLAVIVFLSMQGFLFRCCLFCEQKRQQQRREREREKTNRKRMKEMVSGGQRLCLSLILSLFFVSCFLILSCFPADDDVSDTESHTLGMMSVSYISLLFFLSLLFL